MRRAIWTFPILIGLLVGVALWVLVPRPSVPTAPLSGMDTGATATAMLAWDRDLMADWARTQPWLRIRGHPMAKDQPEVTGREAVALRKLRVGGFKPVIILRWGEKSWVNGIRPGGGQRLPLDLREAFERGYDEGRLFGATGAAFEIENEPDISFVQDNPETYVAFLKAMYLGIKAGSRERVAYAPSSELPETNSSSPVQVIMAPLALPPGPYFEQMIANGLFSYTDAFNYHYYGYAEDFAGVYRQFEAAVSELGSVGLPLGARRSAGPKGPAQGPALHSMSKALPVLLTEYGYGALGKEARNTVAGRVRQWRWFKAVGEDIVRLRIAGPMAFYLPPYFEADQLEFGLTTRAVSFTFSPTDFGEAAMAPWMRRIGERFGENEATPALAWLMEEGARRPYVPKDWTVTAPPASPVVIDFIGGDGLTQAKRYGGYVAHRVGVKPAPAPAARPPAAAPQAAVKPPVGPPPLPYPGLPKGYVPPATWHGTGAVVLYNLSAKPVTGRLVIERGEDVIFDPAILAREWTLGPKSRTVVEVNLRIPATQFARQELALHWRANNPGETSIFSTAFFPNYPLMREKLVYDFAAPDSGLRQPEGADQGPAVQTASEEPVLEPQGRWRVTPGVKVQETANKLWRFHVARFPDEPEKSAIAELPLPPGFAFPDRAMMRFFYRLAQPAGTDLKTGKYMEAYFRTANGNLYQVWPRQYAMHAWSEYVEAKENYTMAFYGRANLPWRFRDNQPVALVFFFRPRGVLPAVYEVKDARIVQLGQ